MWVFNVAVSLFYSRFWLFGFHHDPLSFTPSCLMINNEGLSRLMSELCLLNYHFLRDSTGTESLRSYDASIWRRRQSRNHLFKNYTNHLFSWRYLQNMAQLCGRFRVGNFFEALQLSFFVHTFNILCDILTKCNTYKRKAEITFELFISITGIEKLWPYSPLTDSCCVGSHLAKQVCVGCWFSFETVVMVFLHNI